MYFSKGCLYVLIVDTHIFFFKIPNEILSLLAESIADVLNWGGSAPRAHWAMSGDICGCHDWGALASSGGWNVVQTSLPV